MGIAYRNSYEWTSQQFGDPNWKNVNHQGDIQAKLAQNESSFTSREANGGGEKFLDALSIKLNAMPKLDIISLIFNS